MENKAKIAQDLMNATKFLNLNQCEAAFAQILKNVEEKETEMVDYFSGLKRNVQKCLDYQQEKCIKFEKEIKSMSDDLILERIKSKEFFDEVL